MSDPWEDPTAKAWIRHVITDMVPKMSDSAAVISLVTDTEGDVKFWVELGASIMLDKPLIAVVFGDVAVPRKLALVADEILRCPEGVDMVSSTELKAALTRVLGPEVAGA